MGDNFGNCSPFSATNCYGKICYAENVALSENYYPDFPTRKWYVHVHVCIIFYLNRI